VLGAGIVSIALSLDGQPTPSRILLALAAALWIALTLLLAGRALFDRRRVFREARSPAALTGVAATAVLGTRLTMLGWGWAGSAMLLIAVCLWLGLLAPVLRNWVTPTVGVSLMLTVSTESLAVLSAVIAAREHEHWLLDAALVPFVLGLAFYGFVMARFELRHVVTGRGDHWISGGALAIATLAAADIALGANSLHGLVELTGILKTTSLVLWAITIASLPVLLAAEVLHPRLAYDIRRWATVFPVGMYAACSFAVGAAARVSGIASFARVWVWVGVALWLVLFAAMLRRGWRLARGRRTSTIPPPGDELPQGQQRVHTAPRV
jgi:tellurite resistance protein TehA-like permease